MCIVYRPRFTNLNPKLTSNLGYKKLCSAKTVQAEHLSSAPPHYTKPPGTYRQEAQIWHRHSLDKPVLRTELILTPTQHLTLSLGGKFKCLNLKSFQAEQFQLESCSTICVYFHNFISCLVWN